MKALSLTIQKFKAVKSFLLTNRQGKIYGICPLSIDVGVQKNEIQFERFQIKAASETLNFIQEFPVEKSFEGHYEKRKKADDQVFSPLPVLFSTLLQMIPLF